MTKRYDEPIEVTSDPVQGGAPLSFNWRGRRYEIDRWLATWREAGEWWRRHGSSNGSLGYSDERSSNGVPRDDRRASGTEHEVASNGVREREYFRVLARPAGAMSSGDLDPDGFMPHPGAVYDVYLDRVQRSWRLARIWD